MIDNTTYTQLVNDLSQMKLTIAQMKHLFMEKLQVGTTIEGQLIEKDGQLLLEAKMGIKLPISLCESEVNLGQLLKLMVMAKDDSGLLLKVLQEEPQVTQEIQKDVPKDVVHKAIETFNLPKEEKVKECIEYFLEKQLPLDRQDILKTFHLNKQINLPIPVLVNLLENQGELKEPLLRMMSEAKEVGKANLVSELEKFIKQQPLKQGDLIRLVECFAKNMNPEKLGQTLEPFKQVENILPPLRPIGQQEQVIPKELVKPILINESLEQVPKKVISDLTQVQKWPMAMLKDVVIKLYEETFKVSIETLKNLPLEQSGESLRSQELLKQVLQILEDSGMPAENKSQLMPIKEILGQLNQLQTQGEMVLIPFLYNKHPKDAEVYFFKPKKPKGQQKKEMYVVVALDMPALNHLEIHLHHSGKQLAVQIQVEDEAVQKHIQKHMVQLSSLIGGLGYQVTQSSCLVKNTKPHSENRKTPKDDQFLHGFDYKV